VTFDAYAFVGFRYSYIYVSLSGTVVRPADNPIAATVDAGWTYHAVLGQP